MTKLTGKNFYFGDYYIPNIPEFEDYLRSASDIGEMIEVHGLNVNELAMTVAMENSRKDIFIDFDEVEEFTKHWRPSDKQKALNGLVDKDCLIKCNTMDEVTLSEIEHISASTDIYRLFTCGHQELSDVIDYMSQFAFGFYLACIDMQKDGLIDPTWFDIYTKWDTNTKKRGFAILQKYGYLKRPCRNGIEVKGSHYYLFRKSLFQEFPKFELS